MGRIAVAGMGDRLDDPVDQYLHLAPYFLVVDVDTMDYQVLDNRAFACEECEINDGMLDAMVGHGVDMVMVGFVDPNELEVLTGAGLKISVGWSGFSIMEAAEMYKDQKVDATDEAYYFA